MRRLRVLWLMGLVAVLVTAASAMQIFETFEQSFPPPGWATFETGSGFYSWTRSSTESPGWGFSAISPFDPYGFGGTVRQWLTTPQVYADSAHGDLMFYARVQNPFAAPYDTLYVLLSITGNAPANFTTVLATLRPGQDFGSEFTPITINLRPYAGSELCVAFVHAARNITYNPVLIDSVRGPLLLAPLAPPHSPLPADSALNVNVMTALAWTSDEGTSSVDVYLSRSYSDLEQLQSNALISSGLELSTCQPPSNLLSNRTYYWRLITRNQWYETVSPIWSFTTGAGPLGGNYQVGGNTGDFANLAEAASVLISGGVSSATVLTVAAGSYAGPLVLPPIPGASQTSPVTIRKAPGDGAVTLQCGSSTDTAVVTFAGASFITLDRVDITAVSGTVRHCAMMTAGSSHNTIRNAVLRGQSSSLTGSDAVLVRGASTDHNRFENVTTRNTLRGFHLEGTQSAPSVGNVIHNCIVDSARCGIYLLRQDGCSVEGNDVAVNGGSAEEVDGIWLGTTLPGDTVCITGNRIHSLRTSGVYAVGIRVKPDSAAAVVRVSNNFIYDFQNTNGSQIRAIYVSSGQADVTANSIMVNSVTSTGTAYTIYIGTTAVSGSVTLKNNILSNRQTASAAYNLFVMLTTPAIVSDYNIFEGTGGGYHLGRFGVDALNLAQWMTVSGMDAHSLEGDPGFISESDLHILPSNSIASRNGIVVPYVTQDIDDDGRPAPPCRGADEYVCSAPLTDFAVTGFVGLQPYYVESAPVSIRVTVQNRDSVTHGGVPLRLFYGGTQVSDVSLTLAAFEEDTFALPWTTGALSVGVLEAHCFLPGDANPANDAVSDSVQIIRPPMAGIYTIGSANAHYLTINSAISDLTMRGVSGTVTLEIFPGTYSEQVAVGPIPGASEQHSVTLRPESMGGAVTLASDSGPATLLLSGADHVIVEDITVMALNPNVVACELMADADSNRLQHLTLLGPSLVVTTAYGARITGGGNDGNVLSNLEVSGFYCGIRLDGTSDHPDLNNLVDSCTVSSSRTAVHTDYQSGTVVRNNVIHTGYSGAAGACYGIYLGQQTNSTRVIADANLISGGRAAATCCGVYSASGAGISAIRNNMICGWNVTGSSAVYGILTASGHADVQFNSVWMNDIAGSGEVIALADTGTATVTVQNNVLEISETSNRAWNIVHAGSSFVSDYNAFHSRTGETSQYRLGRAGATDYSTLTSWQIGTGWDAHSLIGDPGFADSLNLHIQPHSVLLDGHGTVVSNIGTDFDGEARAVPPDVGADEYTVVSVPNDISVAWAEPPVGLCYSQQEYTCVVLIRNEGTSNQSDVPVHLLYGNLLIGETSVSLVAGAIDTARLSWVAPDAGLETGILKAQSLLPGDQVPANDTVTAAITVIGLPLAGDYNIGGGSADFATPSEAVDHLMIRGVSAAVTMRLDFGSYNSALNIGPIPGADAARRVSFVPAGQTTPELTASASGTVLELSNASYLVFDGIRVTAAGACSTVVMLSGGSSQNEFLNCSLQGSDSLNRSTTGVLIQADSCNGNLFDGVTVSGVFTGILLGGGLSSSQSRDNVIQHCMLLNARTGVQVSRQTNCVVDGNEILPGSLSPLAAACYGVYVSNLGNSGSVQVSANRIHGFADGSNSTTNRAVGIYAAAGSGASMVAMNNFIYDFSNAGRLKIDAIYLSSGENTVLNNSVRIGDVTANGEIAAIYISTGSSHVIQNNILMSLEDDVTSYGILESSGGTPQCNGNDIYGTAPLFVTGRLNGVSYPTLAAWQAAGYDINGISANPGFISSTNLHIADTCTVVDGRGIVNSFVITDIDGQLRRTPPDIGADEYDVMPGPVTNLVMLAYADSVHLLWRRAPRALCYHIYAGNPFSMSPSPDNLLATVSDTVFVEPIVSSSFGHRFYVVTADGSAAQRHPLSGITHQPESGLLSPERKGIARP